MRNNITRHIDIVTSARIFGVLFVILLFIPIQTYAQEDGLVIPDEPVTSEEVLGIEDFILDVLEEGLGLAEDPEEEVSAVLEPPTYVTSLIKNNYQVKEKINISVKNLTEEEAESLDLLIENVRGRGINALVTKEYVNEQLVFTINPEVGVTPGKYRVKVVNTTNNKILSEQDFTWGILAINTNKSIYLPDESVKIAMTVLDEEGSIVCNAQVQLDVKAPWGQVTKLSTEEGSVLTNGECNVGSATNNPDYAADYLATDVGRYLITLTATTQSGTYVIKDRFEVRESVPFDVERLAPTRIYPPEQYPVRFKIKANKQFSGKIVESVPQEFQIREVEGGSVIAHSSISSLPESYDPFKEHGIGELILPFIGEYIQTQGFGDQLDGHGMELVYKRSGMDGHDGLDFAMPKGTPIVAVDEGKVILAEENWIYGHTVVIQHSWGRTYYGHLDKISVPEGVVIQKGQVMGLSGNTGLSTGPHLHFSLKPNTFDTDNLYYGKVDPAPYLGLASVDEDLSQADFPLDAKAIVWNVNVAKGASFEIGYDYKAPNRSPYIYSIGQLQFITAEVDTSTEAARFDVPTTGLGSGDPASEFILGEASGSAELSLIDVEQDVPSASDSAENVIEAVLVEEEAILGQVIFEEIRQWQIAADSTADISVQRNIMDVDTSQISQNSPNDFTKFSSLESTFVRNLNNGKLSSKLTAGTSYNAIDLSGSLKLNDSSSILFEKQTSSGASATTFSWESWEYNGATGGPNEFKVISRNTVILEAGARGVKLDNVPSNINKAIPFITGVRSSQTNDLGSSTAIAWLSDEDILHVERGSGTNGTAKVDVVTVEFTGSNWKVSHGDSGEISGDNGSLALVESADGITQGGGQVGDWGNAIIFHGYRSGSTTLNRDTDLLATYKPGGVSTVNFAFNSDHKDELNGRHFVHVLKNDIMSVTRLLDQGDKINSSNLNISSANLKDLYSTSSQLSCSVGAASDFGSGIRNGRITSTANYEHSSIGTAKDLSCEIQIIDLFGVKNTQEVTLNQVMRHGQSLVGGNEGGFVF